MKQAAPGLRITRVQAMAFQVPIATGRTTALNFLVELTGTDADGNVYVGIGEGQPRDSMTGDRRGTSWGLATACASHLYQRDVPVSSSQNARAVVSSMMREMDDLVAEFNADAARQAPFRGTVSGFESALLDLQAKALDVPLGVMLGERQSKVIIQSGVVPVRNGEDAVSASLRADASRSPTTRLRGTGEIERDIWALEFAAEVNGSAEVGEPNKPIWIDLAGKLDRGAASRFVDAVTDGISAGRLPREILIERPVRFAMYDALPALQRRADSSAAKRHHDADVRIVANQALWNPVSLGRRARLGLAIERWMPRKSALPRAVVVCPAEVGGLLPTINLVERIHASRPDVKIILSTLPGSTSVAGGTLRNLAVALPEIDSVCDDSLSSEAFITAPTDPGIGVNISYEEILGGAKEFMSLPEPSAPVHDGKPANAYPEVKYLQPLGSNGTKGHLLEREALALGLSTVRYSKGAFIATDGAKEPLSFKWSRSPLSSAVSLALCTHKEATRLRLRSANVPVPRGNTFAAGSYDAARAFVERIGFPVVVKPAMGVRGIGVVANIGDYDALEAAFQQMEASKFGSEDFIVEKHIEGHDYRIVVIGNEVVGAILREPGSVTGDGERTIAELVIAKNVARRGNPHLWGRPIKYDEAARYQLQRAGIGLDYVPALGERVVLSSSCSLSQGGDSIDVLDELHPSIREAAIRAVRAVPGLEFCGVDFLLEDHSRPLDGQQAGICELNAHAAIGNCEYPLYGEGREVAKTLMNQCVDYFGLLTTPRSDRLALKLTIRGRVTGVGYRNWMQRRALRYGLSGWVRNVDGRTVEAVIEGATEPVTALTAAAILGPRAASPTEVATTHLANAPDLTSFEIVNRVPRGFRDVV